MGKIPSCLLVRAGFFSFSKFCVWRGNQDGASGSHVAVPCGWCCEEWLLGPPGASGSFRPRTFVRCRLTSRTRPPSGATMRWIQPAPPLITAPSSRSYRPQAVRYQLASKTSRLNELPMTKYGLWNQSAQRGKNHGLLRAVVVSLSIRSGRPKSASASVVPWDHPSRLIAERPSCSSGPFLP